MDFIRTEKNDVVVIKVNLNRATLKEAEDFKINLTSELRSGKEKLVVDLSECEFIDSTFLGTLVVTLKKVTSNGGDLRLVGFKSAVRSMFELTRMYRVFETFPTSDEAVKSFSEAGG